MPHYRDPQTRLEWQEAVNTAHALLAIESARMYGLVTGGPTVNVERCEEIVRRGREQRIHPSPEAAANFVRAWNDGKPIPN